jgi:hypothetical protein
LLCRAAPAKIVARLRKKALAASIKCSESVWHWVEVRGTVEEITEEGADDHIDSLAKKYLGADSYPFRSDKEVRVMYKIKPTRVNAVDMG